MARFRGKSRGKIGLYSRPWDSSNIIPRILYRLLEREEKKFDYPLWDNLLSFDSLSDPEEKLFFLRLLSEEFLRLYFEQSCNMYRRRWLKSFYRFSNIFQFNRYSRTNSFSDSNSFVIRFEGSSLICSKRKIKSRLKNIKIDVRNNNQESNQLDKNREEITKIPR